MSCTFKGLTVVTSTETDHAVYVSVTVARIQHCVRRCEQKCRGRTHNMRAVSGDILAACPMHVGLQHAALPGC